MRQLLSLCFAVLCLSAAAQKAPNYFKPIAPDQVALPAQAYREFEPLKYKAFTLQYNDLVAKLSEAPVEHSADAGKRTTLVELPLADGRFETFAVVKVHVMAAALEAQHPEFLTLAGISTQQPATYVRITASPYAGISAMYMNSDKSVEYLHPVAKGQNLYYMTYYREDEMQDEDMKKRYGIAEPIKKALTFNEEHPELGDKVTLRGPGEEGNELGAPVTLKVYKFACACTGEFSQSLGGNKDIVFAKVVQITNDLNAIYERDVNIRLELIPESYDIIFLDPATDPYPGTTVGEWMNANPSAMFNVLGSTNKYDIGHVFAKYIEGDAIGVAGGICCTQSKGRGCSAGLPPYSGNFFSVLGQEIGHMWNSGHTFNQCFSDSQFNYSSACEPGSGSTIMSYHGSCQDANNNIFNNISGPAGLYYHACSIAEIRNFVLFQEGATCGHDLPTANTAPVVSTPYPDLMFIPISTPFELTGSAVDMDGDDITYCWDEKDIGPSTSLGNPIGDSPLFRWYPPTSNPSRTFPRINWIINNNSTDEEVLPTYDRKVTMVLVARDNKPDGGGVGMDTVAMRATTSAGPFLVTYPNASGVVWEAGQSRIITWDVANTDNNIVNCRYVNIRLSKDGGLTYPITLAQNVPNIGKACVLVPAEVSTTCRVRIDAVNNVFFDISNVNFKIQQPSTPSFAMCPGTLNDLACLPDNFSTEISTASLVGFSDPITLSATGAPAGTTVTFSPNPVTPGQTAVLSISFPANFAETSFDLTVQGAAGAQTQTSVISVTSVNNDFSMVVPTSPAYAATGVNTQPQLLWNASPDATSYDVEVATNPSFAPNTIVAGQNGTAQAYYQITSPLTTGGVYFWRVRPKNECGTGEWSDIQVFSVGLLTCIDLSANDLPKAITANSVTTVESKINILSGGTISDVNVKKVQGFHEYFKDLEAHLIGPSGTDVLLWKDRCSSFNGNFSIGFDDGAGGSFTCPPPTNASAFKSAQLLSAFNGQDATGTWTLRVKDNSVTGGGNLTGFDLQICSNESATPPVVIVNNVLHPQSGQNAAITEAFLKADDPNNTAAQLTYTLVSYPQHGDVAFDGGPMAVGSQFTQQDIADGKIRYFDWGWQAGDDQFRFVVADGEGGMAAGTFVISPLTGVKDIKNLNSFELAPNPASEFVRLTLAESLTANAKISLFNTAGQQIKTWILPAGQSSLSLNVAGLPQGIYAIALETADARGIKKVMIR